MSNKDRVVLKPTVYVASRKKSFVVRTGRKPKIPGLLNNGWIAERSVCLTVFELEVGTGACHGRGIRKLLRDAQPSLTLNLIATSK